MSIINIVKNIKQVHPEHIILIKIGKFYYSYSKDAYIISYIFGYKLKNIEENIKVCAFPVFILNKIMAKLEENKICKTITAHMKFDCNMYIHPTQARGLTPREAARIQSYPDDYLFRGSYTKTYMQIGNSVPPLLGRAIAKILKEYLKGE